MQSREWKRQQQNKSLEQPGMHAEVVSPIRWPSNPHSRSGVAATLASQFLASEFADYPKSLNILACVEWGNWLT